MKTTFITLVSALFFQLSLNAQGGFSSGSMGMMQSRSYYEYYKKGVFSSLDEKTMYRKESIRELLPSDIVPEEIMNYHRHLIAMPEKGKQINVVPQLVKHPFIENHYLMQVGIAADTVVPKDRSDIGMMYVLDVSGSMGDGKLENAKKALITSLEALIPTDFFGLVIFDDHSEVVVPYARLGKQKKDIIDKVNALHVRGGTDILQGLNKGIQVMEKIAGKEVAQTIVVITDGRTNTGIIQSDEIVKEIKLKTGNTRVTAIGVGMDLRHDLLREISEKTHGQFHFIERYEDIQKVCSDEFGSIAFPIGKEVKLSLKFPEYLKIANIYGADSSHFSLKGNELELSLDDLNYFLTQVILIDLEANTNYKLSPEKINTQLTYVSYTSEKMVTLNPASNVLKLDARNESLYNDVLKNFLIAEWAYQFRGISGLYRTNLDESALSQNLQRILSNPLTKYAPISKDEDILRLKTVFENVSALLI